MDKEIPCAAKCAPGFSGYCVGFFNKEVSASLGAVRLLSPCAKARQPLNSFRLPPTVSARIHLRATRVAALMWTAVVDSLLQDQ